MTVYTPNTADRRRETDRAGTDSSEDRERTMGEVKHTNPYTDESFGDSQVYNRGRVAIVDGGEADAAEDDDAEETEEAETTIGDIDHTPREGAPSTHEVYERGGEGEAEAEAEDDDEDGAKAERDVPEVSEE